ncbi:MAG TPA: GNAT family N-acetyltransferase [Jatrophihabitans sp.]|nr:GNAT family N-acetyltransferase [Jatrophihabitans sp.]
MPELVRPAPQYADSFRAAMADFIAEGRGAPDDDSALGRGIAEFAGRWQSDAGFAEFLDALHAAGDTSRPAPPNWTHVSTFWWADGAEFLGSIRIRHEMVPAVLEDAGLIGYDIAPRARRRGHGTAMLRAALPHARALGFDQALISCDSDNLASRRVMENNDGVLDGERDGKLWFWVPTTPT